MLRGCYGRTYTYPQFGLSILLLYAVFSFYTGLLLRYCLDSAPGLETYPDIGQAAFGTTGRVIISVSLTDRSLILFDDVLIFFFFFNG